MHEQIRVWAPKAKRVEVELVGVDTRLPMLAENDGWFSLRADLVPGAYQLRLDGGQPIPDPRARDVESVNGPCHWVDHSTFGWTDQDYEWRPLEGAVLYELHVGTFTDEGTFDAAARRLPDLVALGITHVELLPVATWSGPRGWGYDGTALFAPHRAYGGVEGLKKFVDAAHGHGLGVILDVVYNHLGPIGNYLSLFGPYFLEDRHTPWGAALNFEGAHSDHVRRLFIDNALDWLQHYHFDGLRLDAVHAIHDESATHVLEELANEVAQIGRPAFLIAESDLNDPRIIRPRAQNGLGMNAQWSDDFHHALHCVMTGESQTYYSDFHPRPLALLAKALDEGFVYQGQKSAHRKRAHGRALGELPLSQLLGYTQNHDQVGNRAYGERLSHVCGVHRARAATALMLLSPFTPMLFMGEEWAASSPFQFFTSHEDEGVAKATTEGRRREIGADEAPDPQDGATFSRSKLDWAEREKGLHAETLAFTKALIALRRGSEVLSSATPGRTVIDEVHHTLRYERGPFVMVLNLGPHSRAVELPAGKWVPAIPLEAKVVVQGQSVELPPDRFAILRAEE